MAANMREWLNDDESDDASADRRASARDRSDSATDRASAAAERSQLARELDS
jgi:hypothetical protein